MRCGRLSCDHGLEYQGSSQVMSEQHAKQLLYLSQMVVVVGSELRQQHGAYDGPDLPLSVLQRRRVPLAAAGVLARVEVFVPADQLLHILQQQ